MATREMDKHNNSEQIIHSTTIKSAMPLGAGQEGDLIEDHDVDLPLALVSVCNCEQLEGFVRTNFGLRAS